EISTLMCYEATRDLPLKEVEIETPIGLAKVNVISGKKVAIVPILRAGLGMVDGMINLIPAAKIGHIGVFRDPKTLEAVEYFTKLPVDIASRDVIVVDPMLATGVSVSQAINVLTKAGVKNIKLMCIVASPEGIECIQKAFPDIEIFCCAVDKGLNDKGYIVPGLGDAGDRLFGTK
ncbi:MAG: uracil phosphoribosyltransferase, partial [Clostridia bacterium]